jgi:hypothetical protein
MSKPTTKPATLTQVQKFFGCSSSEMRALSKEDRAELKDLVAPLVAS